MDKGLEQLLEVIANNPHDPVLGRRFMALISELDPETKQAATLRLAEIVLETDPIEALRLAKVVYTQNNLNVNALEMVRTCMQTMGKFAKAEIIGIEIDKIKNGRGPTTIEAKQEHLAMIEKLTSTSLNPKRALEEASAQKAAASEPEIIVTPMESVIAPSTPPPKPKAVPAREPVAAKAPEAKAPPPPAPAPKPKPKIETPFLNDDEDANDIFSDDDVSFEDADGNKETELMTGDLGTLPPMRSKEVTFQPPMDDEDDIDIGFDDMPISVSRREKPLIATTVNEDSGVRNSDTTLALDDKDDLLDELREISKRNQPQKAKAATTVSPPKENRQPVKEPIESRQPVSAPAPASAPPPQPQWQGKNQPEESKSWLNVLSKIRNRKASDVVKADNNKKTEAPKPIPRQAEPVQTVTSSAGPPPPPVNTGSQQSPTASLSNLPMSTRPLFSGEFLAEIFQANKNFNPESQREKFVKIRMQQPPLPRLEEEAMAIILKRLEKISGEQLRWDLISALWGRQGNADTVAVLRQLKLTHHTAGTWGLYLDSLLAIGNARKALFDIYQTLRQQDKMEWALIAWARMDKVWNRLKVWGQPWRAEEGIYKLIELVERRRPHKFSAFAAQLRSKDDRKDKSA